MMKLIQLCNRLALGVFKFSLTLFIVALGTSLLFARANTQDQDALKMLSPKDYGKWESIGFGGSISNDGNWLVYPVSRNNDENEMRLHNISSGAERILANGASAKFSKKNEWLGYLINPSASERKKLEKSKKPVNKNFGLINLSNGDSLEIENVSAFQFSGDGQFVVIKLNKSKGTKENGADVVIRHLKSGKHFGFGNVVEYSWQDEGSMMAFVVETKGKFGNGVQLFDGSTETTRLLDSKEAFYTGLNWRKKSGDLAVYRSVKNEEYEDSTHMVLAWNGLGITNKSYLFDQAAAQAFGEDKRVVSHRSLKWSKDGNSIFFETNDWSKKPAKPDTTKNDSPETDSLDVDNSNLFEEAPALEIWHSKDVRIVPEQKQIAERQRETTHLAVWHLNTNSFVQLGDELTERTRFQDDSPIILGTDATPYELDGMFGRRNSDIYSINIQNGSKKKILDKVNHLYSISPDGANVVYLKEDNYYAYNFKSGQSSNLTQALDVPFANQDDDHPVAQKPPYGFIGWDMQGKSFFVHSKYDIWQINIGKTLATNITVGGADKIISRNIRLDSDEKYIDLKKPLYIRRYGEWTKQAGYSTVVPGKKPKSIFWGDSYVSRITKAKDTNALAYVVEAYDDSPDYFVNPNGDAKTTQVSETNPFQIEYYWGKSELINYTNANGRKLQGSLYYPDNYDQSKKYPMITYIYELRSQSVHRYTSPSQRNYYNHKVFTSQGYFVLQPDIVFDYGDPGKSSVKTMEIAVKTVVDKGLVDAAKVGLVGHSWGGYQSAFAVTGTDIFAAAVAGAGLTDLVSMYGMVAWAFGGAPENNHFEVGQERMMVPPWEDVESYVRNSPVFNIDKMNTPLLFEVGDADTNVDWRQGIEMYNAARRAGKQMVLLVYAKEGHGLRKDKNRIDYHNRILAWFGHYLKGEAAEDWINEGTPYLEQKKALENWKKD